jgi:hypothetical protein
MHTQADTKQLRTFGLMVGGLFALIGLWPAVLRREELRLWPLVMAVLLVVPALVLPWSLGPVYRLWMRLGHVLGWINTKILLGVIFYGVVTPMGLVRRLVLGKDALQRRFDPQADTYRIVRHPRPHSHLKQQF